MQESAPLWGCVAERRMDSSTVVFGLLFLLCCCEGQLNPGNNSVTGLPSVTNANLVTTTRTLLPGSNVTSEALNLTESNSSITTLFPALLNNVSSTAILGSFSRNNSVTGLPSVTNANLVTTTRTLLPGSNVTSEALNLTESNSSITTLFPALLNNVSSTAILVSFSGKCSEFPPLCCEGHNDSCNRGCYCDVACLRLNDCCPDFTTTCVTGEQKGTPVNVTVTPGTNSTSFPLNSYSGKCSEEPALCCSGSDVNCFRGCFCDAFCLQANDCCPDYGHTCGTDQTVTSQLGVSLLFPSGIGDQEVEAALYNASLSLEAYLKNKFSAIKSFRILHLMKP